MGRYTTDRSTLHALGAIVVRAGGARRLVVAAALLAVSPQVASAQFGALKRLRQRINPDSAAKAQAAVQDSVALAARFAARLAAGDTTPLVVQRSRFARAVSAAGAASGKFEQVTGVSVGNAALAATGVGAGGLVAKKLGVDPMGLGARALGRSAAQRAQAGLGVALPGVPGMPTVAGVAASMSGGMLNGGALTRLQQQAAAQLRGAPRSAAVRPMPGVPLAGFTEADAQALVAFQQEMVRVAMAASGGDAAAQAQLQRWQGITLKYQPEIERLAVAASGGDVTAMQRLQVVQVTLMREWANTSSAAAKLPRPVRAARP